MSSQEDRPTNRSRLRAAGFAAVAVLLLGAIGVTCSLLIKAQHACRRAAVYYRLCRSAQEAVRQITDELSTAGNVRVSADGMTVTFQVPIPLAMDHLNQYVSHGGAPPAPSHGGWKPKDVNRDGHIDHRDVDTRDARGQVFWGAREPGYDIWGNFMCYQFQPLDGNGNSPPGASDCIDESLLRLDINGNGSCSDIFLPGRLVRFSTTEGDPDRHPEERMTSLSASLVGDRTCVIVRWDPKAGRIASPADQDIGGAGVSDGPIFRDMAWWANKPVDHPLRKPPDSQPGMWDIWRDGPQAICRQGTIVRVDLWLLRMTMDRLHLLLHVQRDIQRTNG